MGSITESTLEGSLLAQYIPPAKPNNTAKMPSLLVKGNETMTYKISNKDIGIKFVFDHFKSNLGEIFDVRNLPKTKDSDEIKTNLGSKKNNQAWQDW